MRAIKNSEKISFLLQSIRSILYNNATANLQQQKMQWDTISLVFFFFLNLKNTYLMLNLMSNILENNYSSQTKHYFFKERICIDLLQK